MTLHYWWCCKGLFTRAFPVHTRLLESPLLTYDQCKTTARQLLAASKLNAQPTQYTFPVVVLAAAPIPVNAFRPLDQRPHDYCPDNCYWYQKSSPRGSTPRCFNCGSTSHRVQDCEVMPSEVFRKHERNDRHDSRERRSSVSPYRRSRRDSSSEHHVEFSNNHLVTARSDDEYCLERKIEGVPETVTALLDSESNANVMSAECASMILTA